MKRRLIALLLAGAMVATALVGCGSKSDDSASEDQSSASTEESAGETTKDREQRGYH